MKYLKEQKYSEKTLGMEIEVEMPKCIKGKLFGEIANYLNEFDLEFIDFVGTRDGLEIHRVRPIYIC